MSAVMMQQLLQLLELSRGRSFWRGLRRRRSGDGGETLLLPTNPQPTPPRPPPRSPPTYPLQRPTFKDRFVKFESGLLSEVFKPKPNFLLSMASTRKHNFSFILKTLPNPARALRALGLLLADGALTVGRGKAF